MVAFNFSNISGDVAGRKAQTLTMSFTASGTFSGSDTVTTGVNPIVLTSNLTGQGLPSDTMVFTLTPTSTFYNMDFNDSNDSIAVSTTGGIAFSSATYALTFNAGSGLNALSNVSINGGANVESTLAVWITSAGTQSIAGTFAGEVTGIRFTTTLLNDEFNLTSISGTPTCFAHDTMIATPAGERAVQFLKVGDKILTHDGDTREVLWLGHQSFDTSAGVPDHLRPVRISAGALGDGLPKRDLVVTADHALLIDGVLINASALVNDETITFDAVRNIGKCLTVFHVETEDHAIILAEGCAAETYVDATERSRFDNYQQYLDLYEVERVIPEGPFLRIPSARLVPPAIQARLGLPTPMIAAA